MLAKMVVPEIIKMIRKYIPNADKKVNLQTEQLQQLLESILKVDKMVYMQYLKLIKKN